MSVQHVGHHGNSHHGNSQGSCGANQANGADSSGGANSSNAANQLWQQILAALEQQSGSQNGTGSSPGTSSV